MLITSTISWRRRLQYLLPAEPEMENILLFDSLSKQPYNHLKHRFGEKDRNMRKAVYFALLAFAPLHAQILNNGTFLGTVQDPTGAAVPGATVRASREGTQLQRQTTTDAEGNYQL